MNYWAEIYAHNSCVQFYTAFRYSILPAIYCGIEVMEWCLVESIVIIVIISAVELRIVKTGIRIAATSSRGEEWEMLEFQI